MSEFKKYFTARSHVFMRPYVPGEEVRWVDKVHVSPRDGASGSPKVGDFIAYSSEKPDEHFLVSAESAKSYEATGEGETVTLSDEELGAAPMIRNPLAASEAEEAKAQNGEPSSKTVITSKPEKAEKPAEDAEEDEKAQDDPDIKKEESPQENAPKKEEPKPETAPEATKAPAKEAPKFPSKTK